MSTIYNNLWLRLLTKIKLFTDESQVIENLTNTWDVKTTMEFDAVLSGIAVILFITGEFVNIYILCDWELLARF